MPRKQRQAIPLRKRRGRRPTLREQLQAHREQNRRRGRLEALWDLRRKRWSHETIMALNLHAPKVQLTRSGEFEGDPVLIDAVQRPPDPEEDHIVRRHRAYLRAAGQIAAFVEQQDGYAHGLQPKDRHDRKGGRKRHRDKAPRASSPYLGDATSAASAARGR